MLQDDAPLATWGLFWLNVAKAREGRRGWETQGGLINGAITHVDCTVWVGSCQNAENAGRCSRSQRSADVEPCASMRGSRFSGRADGLVGSRAACGTSETIAGARQDASGSVAVNGAEGVLLRAELRSECGIG